jgi:hypothetical protein
MDWKTLATVALGLGAGALGALVPATAPFALPVAGLLLGTVIPQPRTWGQKS